MLEYHSCLRFWTYFTTGVKTDGISESNELLTKKNHRICLKYGGFMVAEAGLEPTTSGL